MSHDAPILDHLEPEAAGAIASRRDVLRRAGSAAAVLSVPAAVGLMARAAYAQGLPQQVVDVLDFALTLERLESAFYGEALGAKGLIPGDTRKVFEEIAAHEAAHVKFLESALGSKASAAPDLDFTAGGSFAPFEDYQQFLLLSQAFEDTGQRAYRGQAGNLAGNPDVLTQALTIHSVEARHAARVRLIRDLDPWVPEDQPDAPKAVAAVYAGMDVTAPYGVDLTGISDVSATQVTEAFDEPLTKDEVLAIVKPFLA